MIDVPFVTVRVLLVGVDDQSAVVVVVQDAVVVVVMVTVVTEAVVVRVQLGTVGDVWTVVSAVLVTVSVPAVKKGLVLNSGPRSFCVTARPVLSPGTGQCLYTDGVKNLVSHMM